MQTDCYPLAMDTMDMLKGKHPVLRGREAGGHLATLLKWEKKCLPSRPGIRA